MRTSTAHTVCQSTLVRMGLFVSEIINLHKLPEIQGVNRDVRAAAGDERDLPPDLGTLIWEYLQRQINMEAHKMLKKSSFDKAQALGSGEYIKKPYTLERAELAIKEELEK